MNKDDSFNGLALRKSFGFSYTEEEAEAVMKNINKQIEEHPKFLIIPANWDIVYKPDVVIIKHKKRRGRTRR